MGEAKRRKLAGNCPSNRAAASCRGHARNRLSSSESSVTSLPHVGELRSATGCPASAGHNIPDDLRADIAQSVRGIEFTGFDGGTCFFRAAIGTAFLNHIGIPALRHPT